jgi:hypothetical protein
LPFKLNQDRRHHIPRQQHRVINWAAYKAGLRQRGSLTVWFTDEAVAAWAAAPLNPRRPTLLFAVGDPDGADVARGVPPCLSAG